jgi:hypothetical protein
MDIIANRSRIFRRLVKQKLVDTYGLNRVNSIDKLTNPVKFYSKNEYLILHNSILNNLYKTDLQSDKFSIVVVLYKNINFSNKNVFENVVRMDSSTKAFVKKIYNQHSKTNNISDKIYIIARKYVNVKDKTTRVNNCFGLMCYYDAHKLKKTNDIQTDCDESHHPDLSQDSDESQDSKASYPDVSKSILRRRFLRNLEQFTDGIKVYDVLRNGIFIDTEFTNDIYDDFSDFPISYDTSILFMIGMSYIKNDIVCYHNFTVNRLDQTDEKQIMENFLQMIYQSSQFSHSKLNKIPLFHWSNAEKYIIEKTLLRYPDVVAKYKHVIDSILYIDLLKVVRSTLPGLKSYSLKYVCKQLLDITYDTDCKNGLDAMCSVIKNNVRLQTDNRCFKTLMCFDNTKDVVNYNKLDTTLLYSVLRYFV